MKPDHGENDLCRECARKGHIIRPCDLVALSKSINIPCEYVLLGFRIFFHINAGRTSHGVREVISGVGLMSRQWCQKGGEGWNGFDLALGGGSQCLDLTSR